ncbi:MAG: regulatory iron-sulfur-containing complex subunit RicT [Alistipes sp.]
MDPIKHHKECSQPEIGRGCTFCNCHSDCEATPSEGCFKLHETQWTAGYPDNIASNIFEVRFKNTRRSYFINENNLPLQQGDIVAVEASPGHDIGIISLTGDMVAKQMRRVGFNPFNGEFKKIYRKAKPYDIERWQEAIAMEHETMIASRQLAAEMGLNMKIGDVEFQGDKIKAIFYYIADERVDFRELIKVFAEQFHIRIEMKQIGARQEAGRIGGLGACGRELCCASWIAGFTSVTTNAARMQEVSLNPQKLAGQCSKLKCCLMYEYDTYTDARKSFPRLKDPLQALDGDYFLVKSDVLAGTMSFSSSKDALVNMVILPIARVKEIMELNRAGKKVDQLQGADVQTTTIEEPTYHSEEDSITRFDSHSKSGRGGKGKNGPRRDNRPRNNEGADRNGESRPPRPKQVTTAENGERPIERKENRDRPNNNREARPQRPQQQPSTPSSVSENKERPVERKENGDRNNNRHGRNNRGRMNRRPTGENGGTAKPSGSAVSTPVKKE